MRERERERGGGGGGIDRQTIGLGLQLENYRISSDADAAAERNLHLVAELVGSARWETRLCTDYGAPFALQSPQWLVSFTAYLRITRGRR